MRVVSKAFRTWSKKVQRRLLYATFENGSMRFIVRKRPATRTFVAFSDGSQVMGWLMVFPTPFGKCANVFVNERFRGRGVADRLFEAALRREQRLFAFGWDPHSRGLFRRVKKRHPGRLVIRDWQKFKARYGPLQDYCL
ncbi:hypothetical protein AMJ57_00645 [Parcubacteria bacterium SG8_24]|nr:MAG: hypothetical protein AMJ57_00645 [Parcubacteria bacterium SG8_24]